MFDFLGRGKTDRRSSVGRKVRVPVTIGFEQLEMREMLSTGIALTIIPSRIPPLASMPRPIVGSANPEADAEGAIVSPIRVTMEPKSDRRWTRPWPFGGRFRLG